MGIVDFLGLEPLDEEGEVIVDLLSVEDPVYHVTAEQTHLDLVAGMRVNLCVLVDGLEDVGCGRSIREFELVK